jgi:hypothetical protein
MDVSEAKRLRQLKDENAELKILLAEQMLDATVNLPAFCFFLLQPCAALAVADWMLA